MKQILTLVMMLFTALSFSQKGNFVDVEIISQSTSSDGAVVQEVKGEVSFEDIEKLNLSAEEIETQMIETQEWINDFLDTYSIKRDSLNYQAAIVNLNKKALSGFIIWISVQENDKSFMYYIDLDKIGEMYFEEIEGELTLITHTKKSELSFFRMNMNDKSLSKSSAFIIKIRSAFTYSDIENRVLRAFINLIKYNQLYIKKTQKF